MASDDFGGDSVGSESARNDVPYMDLVVKRDERSFVYLLIATYSRLGMSLEKILETGASTVRDDENNDNAERLHAALIRLSGSLAKGGRLLDIFIGAGFQLFPQERMLLSIDYDQIRGEPHLAATLFSALADTVPVKAA